MKHGKRCRGWRTITTDETINQMCRITSKYSRYAALTWLICCGCGYAPDLPPVAIVSGVVTLDGQPLARGTVQFIPDHSKQSEGPAAIGFIQSDGTYSLKTAGVDGAMVGFHKIAVIARQEPQGPADPLPESLIPLHYNHPDTSGLSEEVITGQENIIDLKLSRKR